MQERVFDHQFVKQVIINEDNIEKIFSPQSYEGNKEKSYLIVIQRA